MALVLHGQKDCHGTIRGRVVDVHTLQPIPFATIQIENTQDGTISDEDGYFIIENVCEGEIHLVISHIGYKTLVHHHDFHHPNPTILLAASEIELEGIVIEDERDYTRLKTAMAQSKKLESLDNLGQTIGDITRELSGVSTLRTGQNTAKPMVHGLHSNRVLIINNGVRHAYQAWGREHAPEIDPNQVDRLKLVKGAATVRYGPEALGGVIIYDQKQPVFDQPLNADIYSGYASNGRSWTAATDLSQGGHRLAWRAGVSGTKQGDLQAADYMLTNTGKEEIGYFGQFVIHRPSLDLEFYTSHFAQKLGILRGSVVGNVEDLANAIGREPPQGTRAFSYEMRTPNQETVHDLYKVKGSLYKAGHELTLQYALQRNLRQEFDIRRGTNNQIPSIDLELFTHTLDADWKYPMPENWDATSGVQWYYQDNNNIFGTNTTPFVPNYNVTNVGAYSIHSYRRGPTTYEAGIRYDFQFMSARGRDRSGDLFASDLSYHNFTFTIGLIHSANDTWTFRTNVGTAWRPPNVGELFSFGKHQFNFEYGIWRYRIDENGDISTSEVLDQSSRPVKSEQGIKWIAGVTMNRETVQLELVPYVNLIRNFFYNRPYGITNTTRGPFPYFIYDQTDALFTGVDVDVRIQHSAAWESEWQVSYVHARDLGNDSFFLEIPPLRLAYGLNLVQQKWTTGLSVEWNARQFQAPRVIVPEEFLDGTEDVDLSTTFDFMPAPDGYFLANWHLKYQTSRFTALLQIDNLLNTSYRSYTDRLRYFADDLGRNVRLGLHYRLSK